MYMCVRYLNSRYNLPINNELRYYVQLPVTQYDARLQCIIGCGSPILYYTSGVLAQLLKCICIYIGMYMIDTRK